MNLVGILVKSGAQTFHAVHVAGARAAAKAAKEAGAKTFVHVSAIGADRKSWGKYGRTKAAGEAAVLAEFPGSDHPAAFAGVRAGGPAFQSLRRHGARVAVPAADRRRQDPVAAGLRRRCGGGDCSGLAGGAKPRTIYELGGPDVVTFRQLLDLTQEWSARKRWYVRIPFWLAQVGAFLTVPLPNSLRPLTVDQVRMLTQPNVVSDAAIREGRTLAGLGIDQPARHGDHRAGLPRALPARTASSPAIAAERSLLRQAAGPPRGELVEPRQTTWFLSVLSPRQSRSRFSSRMSMTASS